MTIKHFPSSDVRHGCKKNVNLKIKTGGLSLKKIDANLFFMKEHSLRLGIFNKQYLPLLKLVIIQVCWGEGVNVLLQDIGEASETMNHNVIANS